MMRVHKHLIYICSITLLLLIMFNYFVQVTRYDKSLARKHNLSYKVTNAKKDLLPTVPKIDLESVKTNEEKNTTATKKELDDKSLLALLYNTSESAKSEIVQQVPEKVLKRFLQLPSVKYDDEIAILTPIRNAAASLRRFGDQIGKLEYPHRLISIYFGEDGSSDNTLIEANRTAYNLRTLMKVNSADVVRLNISGGYRGLGRLRHEQNVQDFRRAHMALARNRLLRYALLQKKFDYILWIDSDIGELPVDLIQQMLFAKSDVVTTCCLMRNSIQKVKYDRNSWRETNDSLKYQSNLQLDRLVLEGYSKTIRLQLPDLKSEGRIVKLDGVGGCALMIKADCHRSGLHFPEVVYKHHIETEGLAKLAQDMGYNVVGLPFVEVFHV